MTHRYTLLIRGTVISGRDEPDVAAIAWAADTVIALGSDDEVRRISRGDSHVIDLDGASVVALDDGADARWPPETTLEIGGRADLAVLEGDPRLVDPQALGRLAALALVRGGRVVAARLPGEPGRSITLRIRPNPGPMRRVAPQAGALATTCWQTAEALEHRRSLIAADIAQR